MTLVGLDSVIVPSSSLTAAVGRGGTSRLLDGGDPAGAVIATEASADGFPIPSTALAVTLLAPAPSRTWMNHEPSAWCATSLPRSVPLTYTSTSAPISAVPRITCMRDGAASLAAFSRTGATGGVVSSTRTASEGLEAVPSTVAATSRSLRPSSR